MNVSDRPAMRRRLVEVLHEALDGVQVSYAYPQMRTANEAVWLGDVTGTMSTADIAAPRPGRNDDYEIQLVIAVAGMANEEAADERCQEILTDVCEALFTGDRMGADFLRSSIHPGRLDGPTGFRGAPSEPAASVAQLTLSISTVIRGALS